MTTSDLPLCKDFIIAGIIKLRKPPTRKATAQSGLGLNKLAGLMKASPYTDVTFASTLREMIEEGVILLTARLYHRNNPDNRSYKDRILRSDNIPSGFDFQDNVYQTDLEGDLFTPYAECSSRREVIMKNHELDEADVQFLSYTHIRVYIASHELPKSVETLKSRTTIGGVHSERDKQLVAEIITKLS